MNLRYDDDLVTASKIFTRIAETELAALAKMDRGWGVVQTLPKETPAWRQSKVA